MNKKNQLFGRLTAAALLAVTVAACGSTQGTSSALAGTPADGSANAAHLTEFDVNDTKAPIIDAALQQAIALDQKNQQQRLAQQGANTAGAAVAGFAIDVSAGPALVP